MPSDLRQHLLEMLQGSLPGEAAHLKMTPLSRPDFKQAIREAEKYRPSGVSLVLYPQADDHELLLIQRPEYEGKHSGQVSFPGGKKEADDPDLRFTAMRECREEIGVWLNDEHHLGALTDVYIPVSGFMVQPHVFYLDSKPQLQADPYEVAEIFSIRVSDLQRNEVIKRTSIRITSNLQLKEVPYFDLADKVIWGATAVILSEFREILP